jgi:hypothetical protein
MARFGSYHPVSYDLVNGDILLFQNSVWLFEAFDPRRRLFFGRSLTAYCTTGSAHLGFQCRKAHMLNFDLREGCVQHDRS